MLPYVSGCMDIGRPKIVPTVRSFFLGLLESDIALVPSLPPPHS